MRISSVIQARSWDHFRYVWRMDAKSWPAPMKFLQVLIGCASVLLCWIALVLVLNSGGFDFIASIEDVRREVSFCLFLWCGWMLASATVYCLFRGLWLWLEVRFGFFDWVLQEERR